MASDVDSSGVKSWQILKKEDVVGKENSCGIRKKERKSANRGTINPTESSTEK